MIPAVKTGKVWKTSGKVSDQASAPTGTSVRLFMISYSDCRYVFTFDLCPSWSSTARYMQWPSEEISRIWSCFWASIWAKIKPSWCLAPCRFSTSASAILLSRSFSWAAFLSWVDPVKASDLKQQKSLLFKLPMIEFVCHSCEVGRKLSWIIILLAASSRLPWWQQLGQLRYSRLGGLREKLIHPSFLSLGYSWLFDFLLLSVSHLQAFHSIYRLFHLERVRDHRMRGPLPHCPRPRNHNFKHRDLHRTSSEPCQLFRCTGSKHALPPALQCHSRNCLIDLLQVIYLGVRC